MIVYHGSPYLVSVPMFGEGNPHNDYGLGFYCTENLELAKEWACPDGRDGFANQYRLDAESLSCMDLCSKQYNILNWMAILVKNRVFDISYPIAARGKQYLMDNFLPNYEDYDIIKGYRADDSYFSFTRAFLSNTITLGQLSRAMRLGNLGIQIVLRSPLAFDSIWKECSYHAQASEYHVKRVSRDRRAREGYLKMLEEPETGGVYLSQIIDDHWTNEHPGLQ